MSQLFDRKYSLIIADPTIRDQVVYDIPDLLKRGANESAPLSGGSLDTTKKVDSDWRSVADNAVEITDLQVTASIKSSADSSSGTTGATIKVYNLSKWTRDKVEKKGNYVAFSAGYAQDIELPLVFTGQVESFSTERMGRDMVTTLTCKDGYFPINSVRISRKFTKKQTYADVINYLVGVYRDNGISEGLVVVDNFEEEVTNYVQLPALKNTPSGTPLLNGYSATGFLHQILENVCKQIGYVSYITNGKIYVHPKNYTSSVEQYSFSSKIMKSIRKAGESSTDTSVSEGLRGIKIVTFLDGRLDIDKRIKITDGDHQGTYKIITKSHDLDYISGGWDTTIICTEVKT